MYTYTYINTYIYIFTHTHTYIYICIYIDSIVLLALNHECSKALGDVSMGKGCSFVMLWPCMQPKCNMIWYGFGISWV